MTTCVCCTIFPVPRSVATAPYANMTLTEMFYYNNPSEDEIRLFYDKISREETNVVECIVEGSFERDGHEYKKITLFGSNVIVVKIVDDINSRTINVYTTVAGTKRTLWKCTQCEKNYIIYLIDGDSNTFGTHVL